VTSPALQPTQCGASVVSFVVKKIFPLKTVEPFKSKKQMFINDVSCYLSKYHRGVAEHAEKAFRKLCDLSVSAVQSIPLLLIHPNVATGVKYLFRSASAQKTIS
jgi:catabolite regulation protein CreA